MSEQTVTEHGPVRQNVGTCPACRDYLWADVWIATTVSPPTLDREGKAHVCASAKPTAMRVSHECRNEGDE